MVTSVGNGTGQPSSNALGKGMNPSLLLYHYG